MVISKVQLGKNGITDNFLETLRSHFKKHSNVKIIVLKSAGHEKETVKGYQEEIIKELGNNYVGRTVGFVINVRRLRREAREEEDL
jgi:RNA-binding protein YhbY|tara:strand:- start:655 stop:912 length:258 start_codon:yes stop_codon:yes gene_type:complete